MPRARRKAGGVRWNPRTGGMVRHRCRLRRTATGLRCARGSDCEGGVSRAGVCRLPVCDDGVKNGPETGKDCGDGCPRRCPAGEGLHRHGPRERRLLGRRLPGTHLHRRHRGQGRARDRPRRRALQRRVPQRRIQEPRFGAAHSHTAQPTTSPRGSPPHRHTAQPTTSPDDLPPKAYFQRPTARAPQTLPPQRQHV